MRIPDRLRRPLDNLRIGSSRHRLEQIVTDFDPTITTRPSGGRCGRLSGVPCLVLTLFEATTAAGLRGLVASLLLVRFG